MKQYLLLSAFLLTNCQLQQGTGGSAFTGAPGEPILHKEGLTPEQRFSPPEGYSRIPGGSGSIAAYLRSLPLKPDGSPVLYYNGAEKPNPRIYAAVLAMEIGGRDLQQCADAVMRLRAEYLFAAGRGDEIHFNFTNGFRAEWSRWRQGWRIAVKGNSARWVKTAAPDAGHASLRAYLDLVFNYAGSLSLSRELRSVPDAGLQPGDVFIQGGSPGHAVTVMDVAVNEQGRKVYLLSQSYMPAQDIQILHNPANPGISPWYEWNPEADALPTPQWDFKPADLRRF